MVRLPPNHAKGGIRGIGVAGMARRAIPWGGRLVNASVRSPSNWDKTCDPAVFRPGGRLKLLIKK